MKTSYKVFIAKIIHFFLTRLLKINTKQIVKRNNINYSLDLNEGIDLSIFLFGKFQAEIIKSIFRVTKNFKDKFVVLDIGSNIGEKSLSLSQIFKKNNLDYFIHSIEPTDFAYEKQIQNLDLNQDISRKIKLHKLYLSNKTRPDSTYSSWNLIAEKTHKIHKGILKKIGDDTKIQTLDQFIFQNNIEYIKIIKIDVDGHELNILKSGKQFFLKQNPIVIMEFAPYALIENGSNISDFYSFLTSINYRIYNLNFKELKKINVKEGRSVDIILSKNKLDEQDF